MLFYRSISRYSPLIGYMEINQICQKYKNNQFEYACICDLNNMSGFIEFQNTCIDTGLKPIYGVKIISKHKEITGTCDVLFKNYKGYQKFLQKYNSKIFNIVHNKEEKIIFELEEIVKITDIIIILGNINSIIESAINKSNQYADNMLKTLEHQANKNTNIYICISNINNTQENLINKYINQSINKNTIDTNNIICSQPFIHPENKDMHNINMVLASIQAHKQVIQLNDQDYYDKQYTIYNYKQYISNISEQNKFHIFVQNTTQLINQISQFDIFDNRNPSKQFVFEIQNARSKIISYSKKNLIKIIKKAPHLQSTYLERFEYEITTYDKINIYSILYIVHDFILFSKKQNIPIGPGRGSCVGSLICYLLNITEVDPIKHDLIFERFLNIHRLSMPDIDIDVCNIKRKDLLNYINQKYTSNKDDINIYVAHIIVFLQLTAKSSFKDVAKSLGIFRFKEANYLTSLENIDEHKEWLKQKIHQIKSLIENTTTENIEYIKNASLRTVQEIRKIYITKESVEENLKNSNDKNSTQQSLEVICGIINNKYAGIERCINISESINNCIKSTGVHAAGIIISNINLINNMPLSYGSYNNKEKVITTQFNLDQLANIGIMKFDILGLESLTVIQETIIQLKKIGKKINSQYKNIINDRIIYIIAYNGFTKGIFQLDKYNVARMSKMFKTSKFEDIVAITAINRPGAINMSQEYMKNNYSKSWINKSKKLKIYDIVKETRGLILFQEQIMKASMVVSNFTASEADILRHAISKKKTSIVLNMKEDFISRSIENNYTEQEANDMFKIIEKFTGYSFNKSHAVAYSYITAMTLYLKTINPQIFLSQWMNHKIKHKSKIRELVIELVQISNNIYFDIGNSKQLYTKFNYTNKDFPKLEIPIHSIVGLGESTAESLNYHMKNKNDIFLSSAQAKINSKCIKELKSLGFFNEKTMSEINNRIKTAQTTIDQSYHFNIFKEEESYDNSMSINDIIKFEHKTIMFSYNKLNILYILRIIIKKVYLYFLYIVCDKYQGDVVAINLLNPTQRIRSQYYSNLNGDETDIIYICRSCEKNINITSLIISNQFQIPKEIHTILNNKIEIHHNNKYKINNSEKCIMIKKNYYITTIKAKNINIETIIFNIKEKNIIKVKQQELLFKR